MATRSDYVSIERAVASATNALINAAIEHPETTAEEMAVQAGNLFTISLAKALDHNKNYDSNAFIEAVNVYLQELEQPTKEFNIPFKP